MEFKCTEEKGFTHNMTLSFIRVLSKTSLLTVLLSGVTAAATPFDLEFGSPKVTENPLGKSRILVVCLPEHATIKSQQADPLYSSMDWQGFEQRDLVIVEMRKYAAHIVKQHDKGKTVPRYEIANSEGHGVGSRTKGISIVSQCENKLEYVLIGKDGTQKSRWDLFPQREDLYSIIDAMPMRRFEVRQQKEKN